jgi:hypothetical protein
MTPTIGPGMGAELTEHPCIGHSASRGRGRKWRSKRLRAQQAYDMFADIDSRETWGSIFDILRAYVGAPR